MTIETYENVFKHLEVQIVDNTLMISPKDVVNFFGEPKVKIHITTPVLKELSLSGGSRAELITDIKVSRLRFLLAEEAESSA